MQADLGPWRAKSENCWSKVWTSGGKVSPSRLRRRERRAAERERSVGRREVAAKAALVPAAVKAAEGSAALEAAAENAAAKKAAAEIATTATKAAESVATKGAVGSAAAKTVAESVASKAAAESAVAKAATESDASKATVESVASKAAAESAAAKSAAAKAAKATVVETSLAEYDLATTSTSGMTSQPLCWSCNREMTSGHQCDEVATVKSSGSLQNSVAHQGNNETVSPSLQMSCLASRQSDISAPNPPDPVVSNADPGRTVAPRRGLNITKFCAKCEQRHPVWNKCQPVPPL